jgi:hypothetical protein
MHTGIGSVLIQAHLAKVTKVFVGLPLISFFVVLAFVILENLLGFPVIYIGALVELHSIIIFHTLYYTLVGLNCQGLNPKYIVLALLAQARDGELLEGEGIAEGGVENIATTASADPLLDSFLACEGRLDEATEECLNLRCFVCCFHKRYYTLSRVGGQGFVVVFFAVVSLG